MPSSLSILFALLVQALGIREDNIPTFQIDLNLEPRERWKHVSQHFKLWFRDNWKLTEIEVPHDPWSPEEKAQLLDLIDPDYKEEIEGLVEALGSPHATVDQYMRQQLLYELGLTQGFDCTGIIATKKEGVTIHGRNLDLGEKFKWAEAITIYVEFVRDDKVIARGITFFGTIGVHTGIHLDGEHWTIEQNTRLEKNENFGSEASGPRWVRKTKEAMMNGGQINQLMARRFILKHKTFADAVEAFASTPWLAPQYFVLAGGSPYEGAVVTVGRAGSGTVANYDIWVLSESAGDWVLVQTNDDHFGEALDGRRAHAKLIIEIQKKQWGLDEDSVMNALRSMPVCNPNTLLSWVSTPSTDEMHLDMGICGPDQMVDNADPKTLADKRHKD